MSSACQEPPDEVVGTTPVLIVEDEWILRRSLVRAFEKDARLNVLSAESVSTAKALIGKHRPRVVVSDLNLPDGTGLELLRAMDEIGLFVPVIFVTAYIGQFGAIIPRRSHIEVHEKPLPIETLRRIVDDRLNQPLTLDAATPFSVADYVQLAEMGRKSVVISIDLADGSEGEIVVRSGEAWWARDNEGEGEHAFRRLMVAGGLGGDGSVARCRPLLTEYLPRNITGSMQELLLDCAREFDEASRDAGGRGASFEDMNAAFPFEGSRAEDDVALEPRQHLSADLQLDITKPVSPPPAPADPYDGLGFEALFERGVDALLAKRFDQAYVIFGRASELRPDNPSVRANLDRLKTMGFGS